MDDKPYDPEACRVKTKELTFGLFRAIMQLPDGGEPGTLAGNYLAAAQLLIGGALTLTGQYAPDQLAGMKLMALAAAKTIIDGCPPAEFFDPKRSQ